MSPGNVYQAWKAASATRVEWSVRGRQREQRLADGPELRGAPPPPGLPPMTACYSAQRVGQGPPRPPRGSLCREQHADSCRFLTL